MTDPFNLQRFVDAQDRGGSYDEAVAELRAGRKRGHWMWWIFPQLRGLGRTETSAHYGIESRAEAIAYLEHDVLGPRLRHCAQLLTRLGGHSPELVLGGVDALKLRSSMTLLAAVAADPDVFEKVLSQYYRGERDNVTTTGLRES